MDVARIQLEMEADDESVCKPSLGDNLISERTWAYERGNIKNVASTDANIKKRQAVSRAKRNRNRELKTALREQFHYYPFQNSMPDPSP